MQQTHGDLLIVLLIVRRGSGEFGVTVAYPAHSVTRSVDLDTQKKNQNLRSPSPVNIAVLNNQSGVHFKPWWS